MDRNGGQAGMFFENPEVRSVIQNWTLDPIRFSQGGCSDASQMAVSGRCAGLLLRWVVSDRNPAGAEGGRCPNVPTPRKMYGRTLGRFSCPILLREPHPVQSPALLAASHVDSMRSFKAPTG